MLVLHELTIHTVVLSYGTFSMKPQRVLLLCTVLILTLAYIFGAPYAKLNKSTKKAVTKTIKKGAVGTAKASFGAALIAGFVTAIDAIFGTNSNNNDAAQVNVEVTVPEQTDDGVVIGLIIGAFLVIFGLIGTCIRKMYSAYKAKQHRREATVRWNRQNTRAFPSRPETRPEVEIEEVGSTTT